MEDWEEHVVYFVARVTVTQEVPADEDEEQGEEEDEEVQDG